MANMASQPIADGDKPAGIGRFGLHQGMADRLWDCGWRSESMLSGPGPKSQHHQQTARYRDIFIKLIICSIRCGPSSIVQKLCMIKRDGHKEHQQRQCAEACVEPQQHQHSAEDFQSDRDREQRVDGGQPLVGHHLGGTLPIAELAGGARHENQR